MKRWTVFVSLLMVGALLGGLATLSFLQGQAVPPGMPKEAYSFREVVKQALPAVVSIEARVKSPARGRAGDFDPRLPDGFRPQQFDGGPQRQGFGSGVVVD